MKITVHSLIAATLLMLMHVTPVQAQTVEPIEPIELLVPTQSYDPVRYEAAFMIADAWNELGFSVTVTPLELNAVTARWLQERTFDSVMMTWTARPDRLDPQFFLSTLTSEQYQASGGVNPGGYENPEYDMLFEEQAGEYDTEERKTLISRLQLIASRDVPVFPIYHRDQVYAYNSARFANFPVMTGEGVYNIWTPMEVVPNTDKRTLTFGAYQEPDTLNPVNSTATYAWRFMRLYYDTLLRLSETAEVVPWIAESFNSVDDKTVDLVLRQDVIFHDGERLTAEDVQFTFDYYAENDFAYLKPYYGVVDSVDILDEFTVRFNLKEPFAPFLTTTLVQVPILPMHLWESIENPAELAENEIPRVGSGPLRLTAANRGEYWALETFDEHFNADQISIEGVEFIIYGDPEGLFNGLLTGAIDASTASLEPAQIEIAEAQDNLEVATVADYGYLHLTPNLNREPFSDVHARRALSHAIDRAGIIRVLLDGRASPAYSQIAPVNSFWYEPAVTRYEFDLAKARRILEEAGYVWDSQGRILPLGE